MQASDFQVFSHHRLNPSDFNSQHIDLDYDANSADAERLNGLKDTSSLAFFYKAKDSENFLSTVWNTGTNPDITFGDLVFYTRVPFLKIVQIM